MANSSRSAQQKLATLIEKAEVPLDTPVVFADALLGYKATGLLRQALGDLFYCYGRPVGKCLEESAAESMDPAIRIGVLVSGLSALGRLAPAVSLLSGEVIASDPDLMDLSLLEASYSLSERRPSDSQVAADLLCAKEALELLCGVPINHSAVLLATSSGQWFRLDKSEPLTTEDVHGRLVYTGTLSDALPAQLSMRGVSEADLQYIRKHWTLAIEAVKNEPLRQARKTFQSSMREDDPARKVRDIVDALGSFTASRPGDSGFKFAMRSAALLGDTADERETLFEVFENASRVRNSVAHPKAIERSMGRLCEQMGTDTPEDAADRLSELAREALLLAVMWWRTGLSVDDFEEHLDKKLLRGPEATSNLISWPLDH